MGSYVFKWPYPAEDVHVTGTFDDWSKSVQMDKVGDEWVKEVDLPLTGDKILYKFVVDGIWKVDANLQTEGDGHYNTNNVLYPDQLHPKPDKADDVPGAFPETPIGEPASFGVRPIPGTRGSKNPITVSPGASLPQLRDITSNTIESGATTSKEDYEKAGSESFPESSAKDATEYSVNPLPATSGTGNPINVAPGAALPSQEDTTSKTVGSTVTTSKEDYEKAGSSAAIPETKTDDSTAFSINPIPATAGAGNPVSVPAGSTLPEQKDITSNTVDSAVATSKEDFEKAGSSAAIPETESVSVNPIPASSGIGNPISLPAGAPLPDQKEVTPHTVDSTVTTSKEDYERAGSSTFPAAIAGAAGGALGGAALASAFSVSEDKNIIPESSLPVGPGATSAIQASPFITSTAGSGTTTSELASKVPLETKSTLGSFGSDDTTSRLASELEVPLKHSPFIASSATGTTTANLAANVPAESAAKDVTTGQVAASVPEIVKESISSSHEAPEAAASTEAVREKAELEKELLSKIQTDPKTQPLASGVPSVVQDSILKAHEAPEAAASDVAVKEKADLEKELLTKTSANDQVTGSVASGVPDVVQESITKAHEDPEAAASPEAVKEKADLEKELLSKTQTTKAAGQSATAADDQTSYYGLATTVPKTVEKSLQKAHASPEAAVESSAVAEKSAMERELLTKVPSTDEAGEPAPTIAAATSTTAPTFTSPAATATSLTDGKTANEPVPDTDTSTAVRGTSAGEIAGGAAVGGAAAAGLATLAAKHNDEPPRISDSQKPDITTEASPASVDNERTPGQSAAAAAAVSDGAGGIPIIEYPKTTAPVETSEAATTEYAPLRTNAPAPGVSSAAAAMISDGTEDPTLADEPAVQLMNQNTGVDSAPKTYEAPTTTATPEPVTTSTTTPATATATATPAITDKDPSAIVAAAGIPSITSAGTEKSKAVESKEVGPSISTPSSPVTQSPATPVKQRPQSMAVSSPATSTATSTATDKKKKKRHRLSALFHKIFD